MTIITTDLSLTDWIVAIASMAPAAQGKNPTKVEPATFAQENRWRLPAK